MAVRVVASNAYLLIFCCLFGYQASVAAQSGQRNPTPESLDAQYQQLAGEIYLHQANSAKKLADLESLRIECKELSSALKPATANGLILANINLFSTQPANPLVIEFVDELLSQNERQLAETIYGTIKAANATENLAYLDYIFARYYAHQNEWLQVNRLLSQIPVNLAADDTDYAYLLQGLSHQFQKKHRQSIKSYGAIARDSRYFLHARLNTALANIRQGWVTEAQSIIKKLIPISQDLEKSELTNRMYVILGYALLHEEYFRDARNAFSKVDADSRLANRALFGSALSAVSQGDLNAGLTAVMRLQQSARDDLSRDESYLLQPYIYERLGQDNRVGDSFSAAIKHYQARILELEALKHVPVDFAKMDLDDSGVLILQELELNFSQQYPPYLLTNRHNLEQLATEPGNEHFSSRISHLADQYDQHLEKIVTSLIDREIAYLDSYLNQARYGLARYYDDQSKDSE